MFHVTCSDFKYWQLASTCDKEMVQIHSTGHTAHIWGSYSTCKSSISVGSLTLPIVGTLQMLIRGVTFPFYRWGYGIQWLSATWLSAPSVNRNPAPRCSSNLSSSPPSFIRKLLTNVFSINYCNQSAAAFTGQENTSTAVRRPDNHNSHLSNVLSLPITYAAPSTSAEAYK